MKAPLPFIIDGRDQPDHQNFKQIICYNDLVVIARYTKFLSNALIFYRRF